MNFEEWCESIGINNAEFTKSFKGICEQTWTASKQEILKIIFLNIKQNGKIAIDIKKTIEEIEKL